MTPVSGPRKGLLRIRSLQGRALAWLIIALPAFTPMLQLIPLPSEVERLLPGPISEATVYLLYTYAIYVAIAWTIGVAGLNRLLGVAIPIALTVCLTQAIFTYLLSDGSALLGSKSKAAIDATTLRQLATMVAVIPLGLFGVHCFPPAELISRWRNDTSKPSENAVRLATLLRIFMIVTDAIATFRKAWGEENPRILLPRFRSELGTTQKLFKFPLWFIGAAFTWAVALITYVIEQIPPLIHQLDVTSPAKSGEPYV